MNEFEYILYALTGGLIGGAIACLLFYAILKLLVKDYTHYEKQLNIYQYIRQHDEVVNRTWKDLSELKRDVYEYISQHPDKKRLHQELNDKIKKWYEYQE